MQPHEQEGKTRRRVKPYPAVAPDMDTAMDEIDDELPAMLLVAVVAVLVVIFLLLLGATVYVWSLVL